MLRTHDVVRNAKINPSLSCTKAQEIMEFHLEQAGNGLEKIVADSLRQSPPLDAPLRAWPVVCGSAVAERTRALSFEDGVLCVEVSDVGWKSELQSLAPRYLAVINRYTTETVRKIDFVLARVAAVRADSENRNLG